MFSSVRAFIGTSSPQPGARRSRHSIGHRLLSQFRAFLGANVNRVPQINDITAPFLFGRSRADIAAAAAGAAAAAVSARCSGRSGKRRHPRPITAGVRSTRLCIFHTFAQNSSDDVAPSVSADGPTDGDLPWPCDRCRGQGIITHSQSVSEK